MSLEELEKNLYQEGKKRRKTKPTPISAKNGTKGGIKNGNKNETKKKSFEAGWSVSAPEVKEEVSGFRTKFSKVSRRVFWILIAGIVILMALGGFYFYQYSSRRDIAVSVDAPVGAMVGVPFEIEVGVQNNYTNPIKDVELSMFLPEGAALIGEDQEKRAFSASVGDLEENEYFQDEIPLIIFGNEESVKEFKITVSYVSVSLGPKVRFEQKKSVEVEVRGRGIELDLKAPKSVLNNEDFEIEVDYQNVSETDFSGVELKLDYPEFFTFNNASVSPSSGNDFWDVGELPEDGEEEIFVISGSVLGAEKSFFSLKASLSVEFSGQRYLISEKTAELSITPSPLSLNVVLNKQAGSPVFLNDNLKYKLNFRNNSDVGLNDVVIKAKLVGEMFDFQSLHTQGFYSSTNDTITWNVANTPNLRVLSAGADSYVEFEIQVRDDYPIKRVSDKDFVLKIEAEISSPTVPYYVSSEKTIGLANLTTKVAGKIAVSTASYFDEGAFPPKVNTPTKLTIHVYIVNYSTDVRDVEVKTYLQSGLSWLGGAESSVDVLPTYNERTQEVSWKIDKIPATKGVISNAAQMIFQVQAVPNINQAGQPMPLLSQTSIRAIDEFTGVELKSSAEALTTSAVMP